MTKDEMIEHIKKRGVKDSRVLRALAEIPRADFFPEGIKEMAHEDGAFPIGHRQTISQPYIVAYMSEQLGLKASDRILEIGTGSGYHTAVLSKLVKEVFTIEIIEELFFNAKTIFHQKGYKNIEVKFGDGYDGWSEKAPFDAIILTAAPKKISKKLLNQLQEGGRLLAPIGEFTQDLILYVKQDGQVLEEKLIPVRFVPMTGKALND